MIPSTGTRSTHHQKKSEVLRKPGMTDIYMSKKIVQKKEPFRIVFLSSLIFTPLLMLALGLTHGVALKAELSDAAFQTSIAFDEGVQSLVNEQYARSAEAFLQVSRLIEEMQSKIQPLFLSNIFVQKDDPALLTLLAAGEQFSAAGLRLAVLAPELRGVPNRILSGENILPLLHSASAEVVEIQRIFTNVSQSLAELESPLLPGAAKDSIASIERLLPEGGQAIALLQAALVAGETLIGKEYPHTIAVFFQNSNELRATGGFPGSLSLINTNDGVIDPAFHDIYSFAWQNASVFPQPPGFERLTTKLTLQDSNYNFHFPDSADRMRTMLEYSAAPTAETVVTITDDLFAALVGAVGPLALPGTEEVLTAENASFLLSYMVEAKLSGKHSPKDIIADIIPELTAQIQNIPPEQLLQIAKRAIREKWVLAHSTDPEIQMFFTQLGIAGAIRNPSTADYLAVVSANVGGNKSDAFLEESLSLQSAVALNGAITNELDITREHSWGQAQENEFARLLAKYGSGETAAPLLSFILGAGENHSFTEVFVPLGAELLTVRGVPREAIDIREEHGKTVFAFRYPTVAAGRAVTVRLQYRLPNGTESTGDFDLYFQSQPGRENVFVKREIIAEAGIDILIGEMTGKALAADAIFHSELAR